MQVATQKTDTGLTPGLLAILNKQVNSAYTVYSVLCTVYSVQYIVYSVQYTVYSLQCIVYSV